MDVGAQFARLPFLLMAFCTLLARPDLGIAQAAKEVREFLATSKRLAGSGRYREAIPLAQQAIAMEEKALGADHVAIGMLLDYLAGLQLAQGHYADAEETFKRVVTIFENA